MTTEGQTFAPVRMTLPSGKVIRFKAGLDPNKEETRNYFRAYIAKNYPEDAAALGIKVNTADDWFEQLGNELAVGGGSLVSSTEGLLDAITGDKNQDDWGGQKFSEDFRQNYSLQASREAATGELNLATIWRTVVESAPSTLASAAVGGLAGLAAKGLAGAGLGLASKAATGIGVNSGIAAAALTEGGIGAGDAFNNTFQGVMNQKSDPNSPIRQSRQFQDALRASGGDEDAAWSQVALSQGQTAAPLAGVANIIPSLIGGKILAKTLQPIVERAGAGASRAIMRTGVGPKAKEFLEGTRVKPIASTLKTAGKTSIAEGIEETLQSGGEMAAQNYAMGQVDPRVGLMDGVGEAALKGGLAGMLGGGLVGGGLGAVQSYQDAAERSRVQGGQNQAEFRQEMSAQVAQNELDTMKTSTNNAAAAADSTRAKIARQRAAESLPPPNPQIAGNRYRPSAKPQDPAQVPRIGVDRTVTKPETFDAPKPFFEEFGRARGEVRAAIEPTETSGPQRVRIKRQAGKGKKAVTEEVAAHEEFDRIFAPDKKLEAAAAKHKEAKRLYDTDKARYDRKPANEKKNYDRQIAFRRKELSKAAVELRNARKAAEPTMRKQANEWNKIARANNLPEVNIGARAPSVKTAEARRPGGPIVSPQGKQSVRASAPKQEAQAKSPAQERARQLSPAQERARQLLDAVDKGGVPSNPILVNKIGRDLGLDISPNSKIQDTIARIRSAVNVSTRPDIDPQISNDTQQAVKNREERARRVEEIAERDGISLFRAAQKYAEESGEIEQESAAPTSKGIEKQEIRDVAKFFADFDPQESDASVEEQPARAVDDVDRARFERWAEKATFTELYRALDKAAEIEAKGGLPDDIAYAKAKAEAAQRAIDAENAKRVAEGLAPHVRQRTTSQIEEAFRLVSSEQLPVERTDVTTPEPEQQKVNQQLSDDVVYEIVPVTSEGRLADFRDRMAIEDGSYVGSPLQYAVLETRRGLDGTNVGKVLGSRFDSKEAAEDALSESKRPKEQIKLPENVWERKRQRDEDAAEAKRERDAQDEAAINKAAMTAYNLVPYELEQKILAIANELLEKAGLKDKGIIVKTQSELAKYIKDYNRLFRPKTPNADVGLTKFDNTNLGAFITAGTEANPLNIIALNKNLISPNMTQEQMKEVISRVMRHEMVHAMIRGGLITPEEYSMLLRIVRKRYMPDVPGKPKGKITYLDYTRAAYQGANPNVQEEEAIAELIALEGFGASRGPMGSEGRGIIDRIVRIVKAMIGLFQNKDSRQFLDFAEDVRTGKIGERLAGKIGINPNNIVDPLGRSLQISRADMSTNNPFYDEADDFIVSVPIVGPLDEMFALSKRIIQYKNANNGLTPKGIDVSGVWGIPTTNVGIKFKPEAVVQNIRYGNGPLRRAFQEYEFSNTSKRFVGQDGKIISRDDMNIKSPTGEYVTLGEIIDFSKLRGLNRGLAENLANTKVIVTDAYEGAGAYSKRPRPAQSRILIDGVEQNFMYMHPTNADGFGASRRASSHELQHLINIAIGQMSDIVSAAGAHSDFSLYDKTPKFTQTQKNFRVTEADAPGSSLREMTDGGRDFIAAKIARENLERFRQYGAKALVTDGPALAAYNRLQDAAKDMTPQLWQGMFDLVEKNPQANMLTATNMFHVNATKANDRLNSVLSRLIDESPNNANMYSFMAANVKYQRAFESIVSIEQSIYDRYGNDPQADRASDILLATLEGLAKELGRAAYAREEGENQANAAMRSILGATDRSAPVSERQKDGAQLATPTVLPANYTTEQISAAFPEMKISESQLQKIEKSNKATPFDGGRADMSTSDGASFAGLNMGDVQLLYDIFNEEPAINIDEATKRLNERKQSPRRAYRPNEVQAIVNRLASINPDMARDGVNVEAIKKYESLWGTDKLKGVITDVKSGVPLPTIARTYGIAASTLRAAVSAINIQVDEKNAGGLTPELASRRLPLVVLEAADALYEKGMGIKPLRNTDQSMIDSGLAVSPTDAISANGNFAPSRGASYVMQEMLRESEDGARGRTIGQIMKSLKDAGYRGTAGPIVRTFMDIEKRLRSRYDPDYYVGGGRADMKSGDDETSGGDNVIRVDFGKRGKPANEIEETREEFMETISSVARNLITLRKEVYGTSSGEAEEVGAKMLSDLRKERPILWKRLTDAAQKRADDRDYDNEIEKNLGGQFVNSTLTDGERTLKEINRKIGNYKRFAAQEGEGSASRGRTFSDLAEFMEWGRDKYLVPYYGNGNRADMAASRIDGVNKHTRRYPKINATQEEDKRARKVLSDLEYDIFDILRNGPEEGMLSAEIADEINKYRDADNLVSPEVVRGMMYRAAREKRFNFELAGSEQAPRTLRVIELHKQGVGRREIAQRLYADDMAAMDGLTDAERLQRVSNTVSSIISQYNKRNGGGRADMSASIASKAIGAVLKQNDARKQAILKNAQAYAQNQTGDAVLDQITALHRLFGKHMGNPENFIFDQINMAEGLERIVDKYRQAGGYLDSASNPVFAEDANRGKTRPEIERTVESVVAPALQHINDLGVTDAMIEEISKISETAASWFAAQKENGREDNNYRAAGLYLLAKHAPEREAFIKSKKKQGAELKEGEGARGVGIQLDEAEKIVSYFENKVGNEPLAELSRRVRAISDKITEVRKAGGLIPKDIAQAFQFYVPARGFAERDGEEDLNFVTLSAGSRGRTPLRQDPVTRGRLSLPDDPLTSMAQMLQVAVMRKNVNETLNSLRRLVENNSGLFEGKGKFVATVHYEKPHGLNLNDNPLWLRGRVINGKDGKDTSTAEDSNIFYIELAPEFANISRYFMPSMHKQGNVEKLLSSTRIFEPAMNFLRAVRTSKNPAFLPVNLVRDIGTGFFNVEMYLPGSQGQFLSRAPTVLANLTKDFFSGEGAQPTTKYGKLAKEFIDNGGNQNLYVIDDYDRVAKDIAKKLQKINGGPQGVADKAKDSIVALGDFFEKANNAAELVSRISAYSIAKERFLAEGMSEREAISRAVYIGRNLTVNFNKHGNIGKGMNNLYMFWNASIGGTAQILRAFESSPKVRAQLMTIVGLGFAMPFILRALMGEEYEKIPDWVKDRNLIVPTGLSGEVLGFDLPNYFTVPMPYGYSWFMTMGQNASESAYKMQDPSYGLGGAAQWMALRSVDGLMNNFAPTGASNDMLTLVAPTLADPVLELSMNKDWTGRPIMPEPGFRDTDRESQRYWSNTAPIYTAIADVASGLTGGHNRIDGLIELSPNMLEYMTEFVFGGLGKFVNQNVALASGKAQDVSDIPIVRSFVGTTTGEVSVAADYAGLQNKVKRVEKSIEDAKAAGNIQMISDLERRYAFEVDLINTFRKAERQIERQQSIRRAIENKYRESDAARNENDRQRLEEIKQRIREIKSEAVDEVLSKRR
jgi:hypothetical protein